MFDVDALGRHEAELLREEAARIADTETALQSVLDGDVLVPLVTDRDAPPRRAGTRHPVGVRRRMALLVGVAAGVVAIALVVIRDGDDQTPADQPSPTVTVAPTSPPQALVDPPGERFAPGTYFVDEVDGTPTPRIFVTIGDGWRDISGDGTVLAKVGPDPMSGVEEADLGTIDFSRPSAVLSDACSWEDGYYPGSVATVDGLVAALTEQGGWAEVNVPSGISVDGYVGKRIRRVAPADISDCDTMPTGYSPRIRPPHAPPYPAFRSWDNGPGVALYEPGEVEILWVLDIDGAVVVINTRQWVPTEAARAEFATVIDSIRIDQPSPTVTVPPTTPPQALTELVVPPLGPPIECEPELCPWSPELTAHTLEPPIACEPPAHNCHVAVSPDGTLVAYDWRARTLTWYEDEPRVVPLTAEVPGLSLIPIAIGPQDVAYLLSPGTYFVAVAPSGAEITRMGWPLNSSGQRTATGFVDTGTGALLMPWVDLDGNPISDTRPYPTATATEAGIEVRFGEREWLVTDGPGTLDFLEVHPRSDGGVVMTQDVSGGNAQHINLLELSPDGTIERYFVDPGSALLVLHDGSLIIEHDLQLVRLTPPAT